MSIEVVGNYIGEIKKGKELGVNGTHKWIWTTCVECNQLRWVRIVKGKPMSDKCMRCGCVGRPSKVYVCKKEFLVCSKCKLELPLSGFYEHLSIARGYQYICKECSCNYSKHYRNTENGKIARKRAFDKYKRTEKGKQTFKICHDRYRKSESGIINIQRYENSEKRQLSKQKRFELYKDTSSDLNRECNRCRKILPLTDYFRNKHGKYGRKSICKECEAHQLKVWKDSDRGKKLLDIWKKTDEYKNMMRTSGRKFRTSGKGKEWERTYKSKYLKTEKGKVAVARWNHRRRMANKLSPATLTVSEWEEIKKKYKYCCVYCGEKKLLTKDHIIPLSKGGSLTKDNVVPACKSCNSKKHNNSVLLQILTMASKD